MVESVLVVEVGEADDEDAGEAFWARDAAATASSRSRRSSLGYGFSP